MPDLFNSSTLLNISTILGGIGGVFMYIRSWIKETEKEKKEEAAEILKEAKNAGRELQVTLENQIHELETAIKTAKETHQKDLAHIKETYSSELRNISERIEVLRDELRQQTAGILQLLSKMIEKDGD